MKITTRHENQISIVDIAGEIDSSIFEALQVVNQLTEDKNSRIIINLENATYIDSTGIGSLLHIYKRLRQRGIPFYISSAQGAVKRVFELTKFANTVPYSSSLAEALSHLNN